MCGDLRGVASVLAMAVASAYLSPVVRGQPTASSPAASQPAIAGRAANPHWSENGCRLCHQYSGERALPIKREDINALCWQCHDGRRAAREVHPVGRLFAGDQITRPEAWPAPGGKLGCVTCHDILLACRHPVPRPAKNASFLRPVSGEGPMAFCAACHVGAFRPGGGKLDAHLMLDDQNRPIAGKCHYCHQDSFDPGRSPIRTGDPQLRSDGVSLCIACHSHHVDFFEPGHIGHEVSESMRTRMLIAEPFLWPSNEVFPQTSPASAPSTRLPLEKGNRIMCATCHNPHQRGTFPFWGVLEDGAMPRESERRVQFRGLNKELCHACHD
jgi:predicted CXXCH cytochrome family protein